MTAVRFIHTSDLQLGMTRVFLDEDAQARFAQARIDALASIATVAASNGAEFVVVAGDVFETNRVRARTVGRALEAMATIGVPVYLLPGNHDPLDAATVFRSPTFLRSRPPHVHVLDDDQPRLVRPGVEVIGAPWTSKRPLRDLVGDLCGSLPDSRDVIRIVVGHGQADVFGEYVNPAAIRVGSIERAINEGRVHYVALGDRHSSTAVGGSNRVWYSGAPEPTAHDEVDPGNVLLVEVGRDGCDVTPVRVGTWTFASQEFEVDEIDGLAVWDRWVDAVPTKGRTVARLSVRGVVTLAEFTALEASLQEARDVFGAIEIWGPASNLIVRPNDDDFRDLGLRGFARNSVDLLRAKASGEDPESARVARDALAILVRLSHGMGGRSG